MLTLNHFSFFKRKSLERVLTLSAGLEHTTPLFIALKKLKIRDLYIYRLAIHMFRHHQNTFRSPFNLVHQPIGYSQLQHATRFRCSYCTKLAGKTITTQGPIIWNNMNAALKNCKSLAIFKTCLKKKNIYLINTALKFTITCMHQLFDRLRYLMLLLYLMFCPMLSWTLIFI